MCRATASPSEQVSSDSDRVDREISIPSISGAIERKLCRNTGSNGNSASWSIKIDHPTGVQVNYHLPGHHPQVRNNLGSIH